jgi:hypothetical protein
VTSHEQESAQSVDRDIPDTEVIAVSAPSPVFVDSTGRRRRLLRRLSYGFGGICMLYGGLLSVSLAGGPVSSSAILPLPDLGDGVVAARPSPTPQPPHVSPNARAVIDALPRRDLAPAGHDRFVGTRPATTPAAPRATRRPTPKPSATTGGPVESTSTPKPSPSPSATASPTPSTSPTTEPTRQPPPVPPSPPKGGTGGSDGSGSSATALPAPPTEAPTTEPADATPAPTPQPPADAEVPA